MLVGMPAPRHLHRVEVDGQVLICVGATVMFSYDAGDSGLRNLAAVTLPEMGFTGRRVARVLGITEEYVSMLRARARAEGSAGLMRRRGRPAAWGARDLGRARSWRGEGVTDAAIGKRLGVHGSRWPGRHLALIGRRGRCGVPGGHLAGPGGGRAGRRGSDQHRPAACGGAAGSRAAGGRDGNTVYGVGRDRDRLLPVPVCRGDDAHTPT